MMYSKVGTGKPRPLGGVKIMGVWDLGFGICKGMDDGDAVVAVHHVCFRSSLARLTAKRRKAVRLDNPEFRDE